MTSKLEPGEGGSLFYDPATGKVGEYRDKAGPYVMLRPVGGGREWEADPEALRPATDRERLGASVRAANRRTLTQPVPPSPLDDVSRPPRPVPGCDACGELAELRERAIGVHDRSAETDANVLLRQHQRREHQA
ncbi:hypothetical protein ACGFYV_30700 [Streptomyces sp. NPDC048297]|uniref:hypothetical protein n=1 Tax=Streptomyces sp. NPDC048297 TaxID=3365531 RepID=UPI003714FCBE